MRRDSSAPSGAEFTLAPAFGRTRGHHPASSAGQALPHAMACAGEEKLGRHEAIFSASPRAIPATGGLLCG
jgi:hypothetical protein